MRSTEKKMKRMGELVSKTLRFSQTDISVVVVVVVRGGVVMVVIFIVIVVAAVHSKEKYMPLLKIL